jgi:hypothetical protein
MVPRFLVGIALTTLLASALVPAAAAPSDRPLALQTLPVQVD